MYLNEQPKNLIYIILISIICSSCDLKTTEQYYNLAYELEEKGKYTEAISYLDKAIAKKPDFKPALLNRGADKSVLKNYSGAIEDYKQILKYDSDNTIALMNIGNNYKRLKDYKSSLEFYNKALKTKGAIKSDSIYLVINFPNKKEAESDYYVRKHEIKFERGISYVYLKSYELAIKDLKQAIKYDYELPNALNWIGEAYYHLNDTINARKFLVEASKYGIIEAKELLNKIERKE
ncbi:tetratricopeptide repeat protein [Aquimarina sp. MMG016]|uniref:tetratricopeptide repeat protein n=1 Tax=Aquimarina sp. MMG016 TaxID=2822690 RepID=UPI001B39F8D8|nr:tetratricopeptide repeat protein [Aquimarina sp. MMG016]MBQ4820278.1 tetratricopeptide repeat protein [Aquimarina sp. MMG016]